MNFDLTDDQRAIQRTARDFLAARYRSEELRRLAADARGFSDEQWDEIVGLGWPGLAVPEDDGGLGLGIVELVVLQEELGYALAPTPFLSHAGAALLLAAAGDEAQRERWLAPLAGGARRGTFAIHDEAAAWGAEWNALEAVDGRLSGTLVLVPDGASADTIVIAAPGLRCYVVARDAPGLGVSPMAGLDPTRKLARLDLDGVEIEQLARSGADVQRARDAIAVAYAAESVGVAQRALELAVAYAKDRHQFGRPIGVNQAVSHRCAQMLLEVEGARSATYYAAWALDHEPQTAGLAASMAKAYASDAGWRVTASALQVHGGVGFTWEHDLHFFLKRAKANAHAFGDARWHRARVADLAGI